MGQPETVPLHVIPSFRLSGVRFTDLFTKSLWKKCNMAAAKAQRVCLVARFATHGVYKTQTAHSTDGDMFTPWCNKGVGKPRSWHLVEENLIVANCQRTEFFMHR